MAPHLVRVRFRVRFRVRMRVRVGVRVSITLGLATACVGAGDCAKRPDIACVAGQCVR